jgi:hypothetical protein
VQEVSDAAINVLKARELQAGPGDETALEVHVGEHAEESHNFVRYMVRCSFGLKMGLFDPTLVNAACYISVISRQTRHQNNRIILDFGKNWVAYMSKIFRFESQ